MLTLAQMGAFIFERFTTDLFRLETLPYYEVASDDQDYRRYLRGEAEPNAADKAPWLDELRADTAVGKRWRRVHTLSHPLTDYLRYECEWGYVHNVEAGEDVRILDLDTLHLGSFERTITDFVVIDQRYAVRSLYDDHYRFSHAEVVKDPGSFIALADLIWSTSEPFTSWWARYPQYHRGAQAA
jgi:hypothetical protein